VQPDLQARRDERAGDTSLLTTIIGLTAAICTTSAFLPQVIKAWRSRSTHDISAGMFVLQTTGNAFWLIYGALIADLPLVAANAITLALSGTILALKLRYG
jgi:MtN3 and saliva related transmembrane protein